MIDIDKLTKLARKAANNTVSYKDNVYKFDYRYEKSYSVIGSQVTKSIVIKFELCALVQAYIKCTLYIDGVVYDSIKCTLEDMTKIHHILSTKRVDYTKKVKARTDKAMRDTIASI